MRSLEHCMKTYTVGSLESRTQHTLSVDCTGVGLLEGAVRSYHVVRRADRRCVQGKPVRRPEDEVHGLKGDISRPRCICSQRLLQRAVRCMWDLAELEVVRPRRHNDATSFKYAWYVCTGSLLFHHFDQPHLVTITGTIASVRGYDASP